MNVGMLFFMTFGHIHLDISVRIVVLWFCMLACFCALDYSTFRRTALDICPDMFAAHVD